MKIRLTDRQFYITMAVLGGLTCFFVLCILSEIPYLQDNELAGMVLSIFWSFLLLFCIGLLLLWKGPKRFSKEASVAYFLIAPAVSFFCVDSLNQVNVFQYDLWTCLFNLGAYWSLQLIFWFLLGSGRFAVLFAQCTGLLFGIANHYVKEFRGSPLLPWDLLSVRTAFSVAGGYHFDFGISLWFPILLTLLTILLAFRMDVCWMTLNRKRLVKWAVRMGSLCLCGIFAAITLLTTLPSQMGITEFAWNQSSAYRANGSFLNFLLNTKYLMVPKPEGYSVAKAEEIIEEAEQNNVSSPSYPNVTLQNGQNDLSFQSLPNIIVIMNESFSDLSVLGDFQVNEDYMPFLHTLTDNTVKGYTYVSVHGGSTCNSEFEMLTGSTNGFLPSGSIAYQQYIQEPLPSLATILEPLFYENAALHPYYASGWNREQVYPLLGFDEFYTQESWKSPYKIRGYISDQSDYEKIIQFYEEKPEHENLFLFNVTMQNHSGYTDKNYQSNIHLSGLDGNYPQVEQYLSLIQESDRAFEQLVQYFSAEEEPTVILMFGDHQPAVENSFYEEMLGGKLEELPLEQLQKRFCTPFYIWANFDIEEKVIPATSNNYLVPLLLQTAGLPMPGYQQFLLQLSEKVPAINANGYLGDDGNWYHFDESSPYEELLNEYEILQYNNLFDSEHRIEEAFTLP